MLDDSQSMSTDSESESPETFPEEYPEADASVENCDLTDNNAQKDVPTSFQKYPEMDPGAALKENLNFSFGGAQKSLLATENDMLPLLSGVFQESQSATFSQIPKTTELPGMKAVQSNDGMLGLLSGQFPTQMDEDETLNTTSVESRVDQYDEPGTDDEEDDKQSTDEGPEDDASVEESQDEDDDVSSLKDTESENPKFLEDSDDEPILEPVNDEMAVEHNPVNETQDVTKEPDVLLPLNLSFGPTLPPQPVAKRSNLFVETEADVEEDEFMNFGGKDGEDDGAMDQYDPEFVGEADREVIEDFGDVIELHRYDT